MRKKQIPDSIADDLAVEAKLLLIDAKANKDGIVRIVIWKEYDAEVDKKMLEAQAKKIAEELEALKEKESKPESDDKKGGDESTVKPDQELLDLQVQYEEVFGKKPHHMKKAEKLREEIKNK